jgi:hypothetical protein
MPAAKALVVVIKGKEHKPNRVRNRIFFTTCPFIGFPPLIFMIGKIAEPLYNKN